MDKNKADCACEISMDTAYMRFSINIYPIFDEEEAEDQASALIHEFVHTLNVPLFNLFDDVRSGKFITSAHADEINEQATCRGENMMRIVLTTDNLRKARLRFIKESKLLKSRKQRPKLTRNK